MTWYHCKLGRAVCSAVELPHWLSYTWALRCVWVAGRVGHGAFAGWLGEVAGIWEAPLPNGLSVTLVS